MTRKPLGNCWYNNDMYQNPGDPSNLPGEVFRRLCGGQCEMKEWWRTYDTREEAIADYEQAIGTRSVSPLLLLPEGSQIIKDQGRGWYQVGIPDYRGVLLILVVDGRIVSFSSI